jgi:hypothetical protein
MRTMITTIGLTLTTLLATTPASADCELSCAAECRQENVICVGAANLEGRIGKQQCATDATDALIVCEIDALDLRGDCVGLCGPDLKACGADAKVALKQCKESVKIEQAGCENEVATLVAADRTACAQENADCLSSCVE